MLAWHIILTYHVHQSSYYSSLLRGGISISPFFPPRKLTSLVIYYRRLTNILRSFLLLINYYKHEGFATSPNLLSKWNITYRKRKRERLRLHSPYFYNVSIKSYYLSFLRGGISISPFFLQENYRHLLSLIDSWQIFFVLFFYWSIIISMRNSQLFQIS